MLTSSQASTLKTYLTANYAAQIAAGQIGSIVSALNAQAPGPFVLWRSNIGADEVLEAILPSEGLALTATAATLLLGLLLTTRPINATNTQIRSWFATIFSGKTSLTNLTSMAQRNATVGEQVFSTGTGTAASPAVCSREGAVLDVDVSQALAS